MKRKVNHEIADPDERSILINGSLGALDNITDKVLERVEVIRTRSKPLPVNDLKLRVFLIRTFASLFPLTRYVRVTEQIKGATPPR
jgi:hypothetical protein